MVKHRAVCPGAVGPGSALLRAAAWFAKRGSKDGRDGPAVGDEEVDRVDEEHEGGGEPHERLRIKELDGEDPEEKPGVEALGQKDRTGGEWPPQVVRKPVDPPTRKARKTD